MNIYLNLAATPQQIAIGNLLKSKFGHEIAFSAGDCSSFAIALENVLSEKHISANLVLINALHSMGKKKINFPTHIAVYSDSYFIDHSGAHTWNDIEKKFTSSAIKVEDYTVCDDYSEFKSNMLILNDSLPRNSGLKEYDLRVYSDLQEEIEDCLKGI